MEQLLTIDEVSEVTRVPVSTLRFWRSVGNLGPPSGRVGRRVMYRKVDVAAWLDAQFRSNPS